MPVACGRDEERVDGRCVPACRKDEERLNGRCVPQCKKAQVRKENGTCSSPRH